MRTRLDEFFFAQLSFKTGKCSNFKMTQPKFTHPSIKPRNSPTQYLLHDATHCKKPRPRTRPASREQGAPPRSSKLHHLTFGHHPISLFHHCATPKIEHSSPPCCLLLTAKNRAPVRGLHRENDVSSCGIKHSTSTTRRRPVRLQQI